MQVSIRPQIVSFGKLGTLRPQGKVTKMHQMLIFIIYPDCWFYHRLDQTWKFSNKKIVVQETDEFSWDEILDVLKNQYFLYISIND